MEANIVNLIKYQAHTSMKNFQAQPCFEQEEA